MPPISRIIKQIGKTEPTAKKLWVKVYQQMIVHSRGSSASKLIEQRRPYEPEEIWKYRKEIIRAITKSIFNRGMDDLQRVFKSTAVTYNINPKLQAYIQENQFSGNREFGFENKINFFNYINRHGIRRMVEDPNGFLVWWPTGPGVTDPGTPVDVMPVMVLSKKIESISDEHICFLAAEKSPVTIPGENGTQITVNEGKVYYIVDKEWYYKYYQVGEKDKMTFAPVLEYYKHSMGEVPIILLGGLIASEECEQGYTDFRGNWKDEIEYCNSYFDSFVAYADEALSQFSDEQAINVTNGYPMRVMDQIPCLNAKCKKGLVRESCSTDVSIEGFIEKTCKSCKGTGIMVPVSPYGVIFRPKADPNNPAPAGQSAIENVTTDGDILRYALDRLDYYMQGAEKALHLLFIDEAQSGKAKDIDRESKVANLDTIGVNIYLNIVKNSLRFIQKLRFLSDDPIQINLPASFKVKGEKELGDELTTLIEKNAPVFIKNSAAIEYYKKRYSSNEAMVKAVDVVAIYDLIFGQDADLLLASGRIDDHMAQKSLYAWPCVVQLIQIKGEEAFMKMKYPAIAEELDKMIEPLIIEAPEPPPIIGPDGNELPPLVPPKKKKKQIDPPVPA